ncbi:MAG: 30S ribosomal protein S13 [Lentisphaeria bacterium]
MPRIISNDIPGNKRLEIALTYIAGIGRTTANIICSKLGINPDMRAKDLTDDQINAITQLIQSDYLIDGDLRRQIQSNIRRLMMIKSYRGMRHQRKLPVRGQRTKTNARTRKGKKSTVGAIRDKAMRKLANKG